MHAVYWRYAKHGVFNNFYIFLNRLYISSHSNMNVFTQKFNPITGINEWTMQNEKYDFHQEVARSSYADMLHDKERNQKYYSAIQKAVTAIKQQGKVVKVLDIGTGTGLLSMMAIHSGADFVTACEAFHPVAECAVEVIKDNGYGDKIKVIPKRSTELIVGEDGDMQEKANILVTEVFDTELIGEGALGTFHHALSELLEEDCIVVPSAASVYAQVVQSDLVSNWSKLHPLQIDKDNAIIPPIEVQVCPGAAAVHDLQMAQIPEKDLHLLTEPLCVFQFDFTGKKTLKMNGMSMRKTAALKSGLCEVVFMWWELQMDDCGDIILSCAPPWAHPEYPKIQWRDHWMQAIYYLPEVMKVSEGETFCLHFYHDEYSLWFATSRSNEITSNKSIPRPICSCWMHSANSRSRLGMLNDAVRNKKYIEILKKVVTQNSVCLSVSDGSLLPLVAAKLGAKKVFTLEPQMLYRRIIESYIDANPDCSSLKIITKQFENLNNDDLGNEKVNVLIAEPYFNTCLLPWDILYFWYLRSSLVPILSSSVKVVPQKAKIRAVGVDFRDLWKIRAPVGSAEGFDLSTFDKMVQEAIAISDAPVEPHPLWEYPCEPLTAPFDVLSFDFSEVVGSTIQEATGIQEFTSDGMCNGIALWVDFETDGVKITTGPTMPLKNGSKICWDMHSRQGVYFINPPVCVTSSYKQKVLNYNVVFNPNTGHLNFAFNVQDK